jgi:putative salt-induced outer membrane protein YdiY
MKIFYVIFFFALSFSATSQILNAESLRKVTDTSGFSGSASLDFSMKRDVNQYLGFSSTTHLQYKMNRNLVIWKNDIELKNIEGNKFENAGITHLRYNYRFHPHIAWEIFAQAQYNKVSKIDFRGLLGTGPRFKLTSSENYKFYLGTHIMLEQEELDDNTTPLQRDFRATSYLSFSMYPTPNITVTSTTYYQPMLRKFSDYRVSSQTSLLIKMFRNFAFKTTYTFVYDQYPAIGIPNSQYNLTSGIVYSFD